MLTSCDRIPCKGYNIVVYRILDVLHLSRCVLTDISLNNLALTTNTLVVACNDAVIVVSVLRIIVEIVILLTRLDCAHLMNHFAVAHDLHLHVRGELSSVDSLIVGIAHYVVLHIANVSAIDALCNSRPRQVHLTGLDINCSLHVGRLKRNVVADEAVYVSLRSVAVEHVVLGDAERHVIAAYSADSGARLVGIVGDTKLCAFSVAGEEHTVHLVVCRNSRLCSPHAEVGEIRDVLTRISSGVVEIVVHHVLLAVVSDYVEAVAHHRTTCIGVHIVVGEQLVDID